MSQAQKTVSDVSTLFSSLSLYRENKTKITDIKSSGSICPFYMQAKYTEQYEQSKGKGSFPAMITPGYQAAKNANTLASNVSGIRTSKLRWQFHSSDYLEVNLLYLCFFPAAGI